MTERKDQIQKHNSERYSTDAKGDSTEPQKHVTEKQADFL